MTKHSSAGRLITKDDLPADRPITEIMIPENREQIELKVSRWIWATADSLDVQKDPDLCVIMASDIIDYWKRFHHCTLDDIFQCLKRGRQGAYTDIERYGKFNQSIFAKWMDRYLKAKAQAGQINDFNERHGQIDYEAHKQRLKDQKPKQRPKSAVQEYIEKGGKL